MSVKKVANIAAVKKRDNMIACGIGAGGVLQDVGLPYVMNGSQQSYMFCFVPSARGVHNELPPGMALPVGTTLRVSIGRPGQWVMRNALPLPPILVQIGGGVALFSL